MDHNALQEFLVNFSQYVGEVWVLFPVIVAATFVSEDLTCIAAGLMAGRGMIALEWAIPACFTGIFIGDGLLFLAGRYGGRPLLRFPVLRRIITPESLAAGRILFERRGGIAVIISRFMPGTRLPLYFTAGMMQMNPLRFAAFFALAGLLWTPLLVGSTAWFGAVVAGRIIAAGRWAGWGVLFAALLALFVFKCLIPMFTFRGRRKWVGRICRTVKWEFWPVGLFYIPVVIRVIFLMIRYRSMTVFTAANPSMPHGGFLGESKSKILDNLRTAGNRVAKYTVIDAADSPVCNLETISRRLKEQETFLPAVVKPDRGHRGAGVRICRTRDDIRNCPVESNVPLIVQEYIPGREYGVFYFRYPGDDSGRIFSVTSKIMPEVTGDGVHTLEELILRDRRAVCMSEQYFNHHLNDLGRIPAEGESIKLVEIGTHCRGAVFLDGSRLITPDLTKTIDTVARSDPGFFFGRFDLRVPDEESLAAGRNIKILELNGVTSESTNIYDPGISLWQAYRILFRQWEIAFRIGAMNVAEGYPKSKLREILKLSIR